MNPPISSQGTSDPADAAIQAIINANKQITRLLETTVDKVAKDRPITDLDQNNYHTVLQLAGTVQQQALNAAKEASQLKAEIAQKQFSDNAKQIKLEQEFQRMKFEADSQHQKLLREQELKELEVERAKQEMALQKKQSALQKDNEIARINAEALQVRKDREVDLYQLNLARSAMKTEAYLQKQAQDITYALYSAQNMPKQLTDSSSSTKRLTHRK